VRKREIHKNCENDDSLHKHRHKHIRSLCAREDSRNISMSISFLLMLMLMFNEDIVCISDTCSLIG